MDRNEKHIIEENYTKSEEEIVINIPDDNETDVLKQENAEKTDGEQEGRKRGTKPYPDTTNSRINPWNTYKEVLVYVNTQNMIRKSYGTPLRYEPYTRNKFVLRVLTVTFIMLAATGIFVGFVVVDEGMKRFFAKFALPLLLTAMTLLLMTLYSMYCSICARHVPCSIFMLFFNTVGYCILVSVISTVYKTEVLMYAFLATAIVVFICMLLASSRFDFTKWYLYLVVVILVISVLMISLTAVHFITGKPMKLAFLVMTFIMTIAQCVFLIMELQMILGGRTVELDEDECALGAAMLYNSVMQIFVRMVLLIGGFSDL